MSDAPPSSTLNVPGLLVVAFFSLLAIRWYLSAPAPDAPGSSGSSSARAGRSAAVNNAHVEQLAQMFPQLSRRELMWDLQRNGGNIAATTERVLSGRGLETPPPSFQPPPPPSTTTSGTSTPSGSARPAGTTPSAPIDLIAKYNLSNKLSGSAAQDNASSSASSGGASGARNAGWSATKAERQAALQRRREEMVLAARRRMEAKGREG